jgi:hypothetical protein
MNESCLRSRTINPSLKTTVSEEVPNTCDGWDSTWGEGTEGLEIRQKRKHAPPTFLAEIVQDIKVQEAEEVQTIRLRRKVHANLALPESHTVTSKLMLSPLTFFVETEDGTRVPAVPTLSLPFASPCAFRSSERSSEHMELQKTVKKNRKQAVHMRRKKQSSAKSEESFPFSLEAW